jgi:hypothetical protein
MSTPTVLASAAVMSLLRKEVTTRCIADRFGVTEAQVSEWMDIFIIGGVLALSNANEGGAAKRGREPVQGAASGSATQPNPSSGNWPSATYGCDPTSVERSRSGDPTTRPPVYGFQNLGGDPTTHPPRC